MTTPALKNNLLPPGLVSNLQQVLSNRKPAAAAGDNDEDGAKPKPDKVDTDSAPPPSSGVDPGDENDSRPIILVTSSDGIESPGLSCLVDALVREGAYSVHVVAPQSDKSTSGHSVSLKETVEVVSAEYNGAIAYEISGTPADCVSLALSGALFSWSKPLLVISGVNKGSSCGYHIFYSGVVAGAREALINGVPSIAISLDWKKDVSPESDFKDAVTVCLPIINAAIRDIEKGSFPKGFSLDIEVPGSPLTNKGLKVTKSSCWRSTLSWQAISSTRNLAAARFGGGQPGIGMQFAQLGRDASAAGAARRLATQKKNIEVVESVGAVGKSDFKKTTKYFRAEMLDKEQDEDDEDLDFRALKNGFVAITPFSPFVHLDSETQTAASNWISTVLSTET
ncbi:Survival protein SurE-like phosphatase/nucleotidase [Striga hermonthica]|uniref:Survival protein SurE-like phosphatase/nucleotidase n=1 Tax=Striga hermonthica TaxID=68872 RepID=A0A9N7N343_STRHE|nr:Survival protein SurE-like phosphatase/nucleotidase [Striga hermonthica]